MEPIESMVSGNSASTSGSSTSAQASGGPTQSLEFSAGFPSELGTWGGLVKRKVEAKWTVPSGLRIAQNEALISFWIDRSGNLIGEPEIIQHAADRAVGDSGLLAVKEAAPFPKLPRSFTEPEFNVVIVFRLR
jgi:TonB family protein